MAGKEQQKSAKKTSNRQPFTPYGFIITAHSGEKLQTSGQFKASHWRGVLSLETSQTVDDEIDAQRELEVLLANGLLPFFGLSPALLHGISFAWETRLVQAGHDSPKAPEAEAKETVCKVRLEYLAAIDRVTPSEAAYRLQLMYGANWQQIVEEQGR